MVLSCRPDGDAKLSELRRHSQSLSEDQDLDHGLKEAAEQTVRESEERWVALLQSAEDTVKKAEVQYSLSRELEAFRNQARTTGAWIQDLQKQAESKGTGTRGNRAQIEDRLSAAQVDNKTLITEDLFDVSITIKETLYKYFSTTVPPGRLELQVLRRSSSDGAEEARAGPV